MHKRLRLASDWLSEDGVLFISIDDNEAAPLKLLSDALFGERNFVGQFVIIRAEGGGLAKHYVKGHDYLLVTPGTSRTSRHFGAKKISAARSSRRMAESTG